MKIAEYLRDSISKEPALEAFSSYLTSRISGIVRTSRLEFFPEYTDHGIDHIEETLQTAIDFATDAARLRMTPTDAAMITAAVCLHDFGMHLTRDGFESLIAADSRWMPVSEFDSKTWRELWDEFFSEARRFDGRRLKSLFGENYRPPRPLPSKEENWEDFDKLLVGEFLRRHHHRLAHEIALYGFPAKDGQAIPICLSESGDQLFLADIAGVIARSHGMALRPCIDYIDRKYGNKVNPRRTHVVFLMSLLRIADYFQIQASRAPSERTDIETFHSSFSSGEWKIHQCITDIHNSGDDPEAIVVQAQPKDVNTFLRVKAWLTGLQSELDLSWAVLGEIFGRQYNNGLFELQLKLRRVRSNLDNLLDFSRSVDFVPERVAFDSANSDLLKLLVGPLYNNDVSVGIRELVQNAVDAVREYEDFLARNPEFSIVDRIDQDSDVRVDFECDDQGKPLCITVSDRGIGMSVDVVKNYFLKAGASFRKSDAWRRVHEDGAGKSRVLRSGRFGVGALAAFLLGDEIEVTTRHVLATDDEGTAFRARVDSDAISLEKTKCPVGTKIRIPVPDHMRKALSDLVPADWEKSLDTNHECCRYFLENPSVVVSFSHMKGDLRPSWYLPQQNDDPSGEWRSFYFPDFGNIFWTYGSSFPTLSCNGIIIVEDSSSHRALGHCNYISYPSISIFDKDGLLPISLQRNDIDDRVFVFNDDLVKSIVDDIIANAFVSGVNNCSSTWLHGRHDAFRREVYYSPQFHYAMWLISRGGFMLNDPHLIRESGIKTLIVAIGGSAGYDGWGDLFCSSMPAGSALLSCFPGVTGTKLKGIFRSAYQLSFNLPGIRVRGGRLIVAKTAIDTINRFSPGKDLKRELASLSALNESSKWLFVELGEAPFMHQNLVDSYLSLAPESEQPIIFCELNIEIKENIDFSALMSSRWMEVVGSPFVPFDAKERSDLERRIASELEIFLRLNKESEERKKKRIARNRKLDQFEWEDGDE